MNKIIEFIRSVKAPIFGLLAMIFGLFQMYAKTYFVINPYPIHWLLDIAIALVVAFGFAVATIIIIVHTQNAKTPYIFAFFDFAGYVLYFGNNALIWYQNNEFAKIGGAVFISLLSAVIIFNFGDIFISQVRKQFAEVNQIKELNTQYEKQKNELLTTLQTTEKAKSEIESNYENSQKEFDALRNEYSQLQAQFNKLQDVYYESEKQKEQIAQSLQKLEIEKTSFLQDVSAEDLRASLIGQKRAYKRAINEGRLETAKRLQNEMIANASILGIELEHDYINNYDLFKKEVINESV